MAESTNGELAIVPPAPKTPAANSQEALASVLGQEQRPFYCSFDLSTPEGRKLLFRMDGEPSHELKHMVKQTFRLQHVYAAPAEKIIPDTGEVVKLTRIVLVGTDGKTYGCFSVGIRDTIAKLAACFGMPPWKDGIHVEVYTQKTARGYDLLKLREVEDVGNPKGARR